MNVNKREFIVDQLLGKGKGGYSYLVHDETGQYVLKQIHHEPCAYYQFGDKLASEINDYHHLKQLGIPMPQMLDVDYENERILKQYIEGNTIFDLVLNDQMNESYLRQMEEMCKVLYENNTNIDYFPTNFVVQNQQLFYIDYECNTYMEQWDFQHWGSLYWRKSEQFMEYAREHL